MAALAVQLSAFAITARGLGVNAFGTYTALLAVAIVGVELVGFGGADLLVRGTARDPSRFQAYFGNLLILAGVTLSFVVAGGAWVSLVFIGTLLPPIVVIALLLGEITLGRMSASLELIMVAQRHNVWAGYVRLTTATLRLLLALFFFVIFGLSNLNLWIAATFVQSVTTSLAYVAIGAWLYGLPAPVLMWGELKAGAAFLVNQASRASQGNFDRIILSRFADVESVGIYGAASRVLTLGLFPIQVVTRIIYPNYFVHGIEGMRATRRYALKMTPILVAVGAVASVAVAIAGHLAPFVLGRDFEGMAKVAAWLGLALPLIALQYPPADALTGAGRQDVRATISVCATIGFGFIMALGTHLGGVNGLVAAFLVSHALLAAAMWVAAALAKDDVRHRIA
jgi:O-antigen/teichoic acid export membrane protein